MSEKEAPKSGKQVIYLVGSSHNGVDGEKRTVDAERAAELVAAGAARYPDNHAG